jgi:hypothetical protein
MNLGPFAGKIRTDSWRGPNAGAAAQAHATVVGAASGQRVSEISDHSLDGAKSEGAIDERQI